jgi:hypothetical protein
MSPNTIRKLSSLNQFFDEWRAMIYIATILGFLSTGIVLPNIRISNLEAEQKKDRLALNETTSYMRVLATATCLEKRSALVDIRPNGADLMTLLCDRVLDDLTILALPGTQ